MRLSDADRDRLLERLSHHAAAGTLDAAEHERRTELVLRAATRESALDALSDLPPLSERDSPPVPRSRGRGHGEADLPEADWWPTSERFRDPRSGLVMRVWEDAAGGRHYVAEPPD